MSSPPNTTGIRDNHFCGSVADFLRPHLKSGAKLSVVSADFIIHSYEALKEHLDQIGHMDFLFGEPRFVKSLDPDKTEKKEFIIDGDGLKLANTLQQKRGRAGARVNQAIRLIARDDDRASGRLARDQRTRNGEDSAAASGARIGATGLPP